MSDEKKITENEDPILAELEAYRMGEAHNKTRLAPGDSRIIEDLDNISELFINARPDPDEISESVDNFILEHIKEKSREIRRDRKIVHIFPRYKWSAAAVMGVLVCVFSYNLVFKVNRPVNKSIEEKKTLISAELSKEDIDGNGRINIIDAYLMDRRLMSGSAMSKKLDLNGDGNIDREDINTIVKTAVSLGRGEV